MKRRSAGAVRDRSSTNLIHQATQVKVDIFVAGGTPYVNAPVLGVADLLARALEGTGD